MKSLNLLALLFFFTGPLLAQQKLIPSEANIEDATLREFLANLATAVDEKNKEFIISNLSQQMKNSFGGDGGIEEFKQYWSWDSDPSGFWSLMEKLLSLGGGKVRHESSYSIPYVFTDWRDVEHDPFEYMAITGADINVREKPEAGAKVLGQLSYDIVKVDYGKSSPPFSSPKLKGVKYIGPKEWYFVETLDGDISGFVNWNYIWSPIDYRIGFYKLDGKWVISYLLAGD